MHAAHGGMSKLNQVNRVSSSSQCLILEDMALLFQPHHFLHIPAVNHFSLRIWSDVCGKSRGGSVPGGPGNFAFAVSTRANGLSGRGVNDLHSEAWKSSTLRDHLAFLCQVASSCSLIYLLQKKRCNVSVLLFVGWHSPTVYIIHSHYWKSSKPVVTSFPEGRWTKNTQTPKTMNFAHIPMIHDISFSFVVCMDGNTWWIDRGLAMYVQWSISWVVNLKRYQAAPCFVL